MGFAAALMALLAACAPRDDVKAAIEARGVLRVATLNAPSTYYLGREGVAGFEHDLTIAYGDHLGVTVEFVVGETARELFEMLEDGRADLAAAGLSITPQRQMLARFGPPYRVVEEIVVCNRSVSAPETPDGLARLAITLEDGSAHVEALQAYGAANGELALSVTQDPVRSWLDILADVSAGETPCTILDDSDFALHRRYLPDLHAAARLPQPQSLAWALAGGPTFRAERLDRDLERWFRRRDTRDLILALEERYFGFEPHAVSDGHAAEFRRAVVRVLPRYEDLFRREGERANVPWTLLAAVAYQESHWNPSAKSPTGVRGMMMLTRATAETLGVDDRLDLGQSTRGGARYLRRLYDALPDTIAPQERWWFAAAAYNVGLGHVFDARTLARRAGADPDDWAQVRPMLARLEEEEVYESLEYGYARGREAQIYVRRVRDYADVLEKLYGADAQ